MRARKRVFSKVGRGRRGICIGTFYIKITNGQESRYYRLKEYDNGCDIRQEYRQITRQTFERAIKDGKKHQVLDVSEAPQWIRQGFQEQVARKRKTNWRLLRVELQYDGWVIIKWEASWSPPEDVIAMGRELRALGAMSTMEDTWGWMIPAERWSEAEAIVRRYAGNQYRRIGFECNIEQYYSLQRQLAAGVIPF